jgi:hypothetical protein
MQTLVTSFFDLGRRWLPPFNSFVSPSNRSGGQFPRIWFDCKPPRAWKARLTARLDMCSDCLVTHLPPPILQDICVSDATPIRFQLVGCAAKVVPEAHRHACLRKDEEPSVVVFS